MTALNHRAKVMFPLSPQSKLLIQPGRARRRLLIPISGAASLLGLSPNKVTDLICSGRLCSAWNLALSPSNKLDLYTFLPCVMNLGSGRRCRIQRKTVLKRLMPPRWVESIEPHNIAAVLNISEVHANRLVTQGDFGPIVLARRRWPLPED
jgi:hypothetical protein